jgi:excisionase family DNA binding protein
MDTAVTVTPDPAKPLVVDAAPVWALPLLDVLDTAAQEGMVVEIVAIPDTVTPAEMARRLGVSRTTISRRITAGEIATLQVGNRHRIPVREFDRYRRSLNGNSGALS